MATSLTNICTFLMNEFKYSSVQDASLNGLQVEACSEVHKIGAAVDFGLSIAREAASNGVDLLITHHGLLWGKTDTITGIFGEKVKFLLDNHISLVGIHLPLDSHPEFGNNIILAKDILKLEECEPAIPYGGTNIGYRGLNSGKLSLIEMAAQLQKVPGALKNPLILGFGPAVPQKVCVVSGSAADSLYLFKEEGFDTLVTGEPKQFAYHFCKENRINAIFAGHYATETFGVRALSKHLGEKFSLPWVFIDEPTDI
jgi:dinuclear metal center YbgI/SA1388 family protein